MSEPKVSYETSDTARLPAVREVTRALSPREVLELGRVLASSGYFQDAREAAQAVVKVLAGQELGFGPVSSMAGIYIVKGKVTLSANLIASAIKRSKRYDYEVGALDNERCEIAFSVDGKIVGVSDFTIDDAKRAGVYAGDNWRTYPRNMLFARALTNGAKWYCPDVMNGPLPIQTMDEAELSEPVQPIEEDVAAAPTAALPERVSGPPEGFQPNWNGFWADARDLFGHEFQALAHAFFSVSNEEGALKEYAARRAAESGKTLPEVVTEMRQEIAEGPPPPKPEPQQEIER